MLTRKIIVLGGTSLAVVIPSHIAAALGIRKGDLVGVGLLDASSIKIVKLVRKETQTQNPKAGAATAPTKKEPTPAQDGGSSNE